MAQGKIFQKLISVKFFIYCIGAILYKGELENINNNSQIIHSKESSEASEIESHNNKRRVIFKINSKLIVIWQRKPTISFESAEGSQPRKEEAKVQGVPY